MQLNKTNGHIIRLDKIDINQNRIVYSKYETIINEEAFLIEQLPYVFTGITLKDYLNQDTNFETICLNQLKTEKLDETWSTSTDVQNWLYSNKPFRVIINNDESTSEMLINEAYKTLFDALFIKHKTTTTSNRGDKNSIIYVDQLDSNEIAIVQEFIGTWIFTEQKIT